MEEGKAMRKNRRFSPSRGGHAPSHLRGALCDYFEQVTGHALKSPSCPGTAVIDGEEVGIDYVIGQLWNCTDIMPEDLCSEIDLEPGSTYAMGVRTLREMRS
jgi:hypothetical protein